MRTPLIPLQELTDNLQNPPNPDDPSFSEKVSAMYKKVIGAMDEITETLDFYLAEGMSDHLLKKYVSACQDQITLLSNALPERWLEEVPATYIKVDYENPVHLCNDICHQMEDLVLYLAIIHAKHYNKMAITPKVYRELMRQRLEPGFMAIRRWFDETETCCCEELQCLVLDLFDTFDPLVPNNMNHYQLDFLRQLQQALLKLYMQEGDSLDQPTLQNLLYSFNLNDTSFYNYCTSYITQQLSELPDVRTKLDLLGYVSSEIRQVKQRPGLAYCKDAPNIKALMQEWIQVETKHLRTKEQSTSSNKSKRPFSTLPENFKLQTNMSVPELAALLHILKEIGVLQNKSMQDVFRIVALCVSAENKEVFEHSALQSSYYHISDETHNKMETLANQIIKQVYLLRRDNA